ncbi:GntR family transcriptional regulator [Rhodospirillum rubrum]|uniref:GntR family transcriptional regulator n=1 Tax=Rhodospirillum rubrum TaxID=1085 RepID=UPI00190665AE|nr:GntR family transcriptional regulator [Rhodospirillum rubrum]MBK1664642.1 GntR family transcriptional regulator [Rhodospirillum rubrum]MBK1676323.1 GntR family transcriptional regulator [Rhodospirillum rubrum]
MTTTLNRQTMSSGLTAILRDAILNGQIAEGTQLRQDALARQYEVSRIPVREALRQLEAEGLIIGHAHRSSVVASLSLSEITEIFEIRSILEPHLLRRSLAHLSTADFDRAESVLDAYDAALDAGDMARWGELNWVFHQMLLEPAERPQTMAIVDGLRRRVDRYTRLQINLTDGARKSRLEHRAILAKARTGAVEDCATLVRDHILGAAGDLTGFLRDNYGKA